MEQFPVTPVTTLSQTITAEPLDCSTAILDLSIRDRHRTTFCDEEEEDIKPNIIYPEHPTSSLGISSPGSSSEASEISTSSDIYNHLQLQPHMSHNDTQTTYTSSVKRPRPFKAYAKGSLSLRAGAPAAEYLFNRNPSETYPQYRKRVLSQVQDSPGVTNKNMRRSAPGTNNHNQDDSIYWEKRRKNNEAAKRSRDARRHKEDEIAIRATFLEQDNLRLQLEVVTLTGEVERLKRNLYSRTMV